MEEHDQRDRFCPRCGNTVGSADHFCRACGSRIGEDVTASAATPDAPSRRRGRMLPVLAAAGALLAAALAAGGVMLGANMVNAAEEPRPDPTQGLRARVAPALDEELRRRDGFFAVERRYRTAMRDVSQELQSYRRAKRDYKAENKRIEEEFADEFDLCSRTYVPCPSPEYPDMPKAPSLTPSIKDLREVAEDLARQRTEASAAQVPAQMRALHVHLLASFEGLEDAAQFNADVLSEAVEAGESKEDPGSVSEGKVKTMRPGGKLPAVRAMNGEAVRMLRALGLPLSRYDVPGGRDLDPGDASDEL